MIESIATRERGKEMWILSVFPKGITTVVLARFELTTSITRRTPCPFHNEGPFVLIYTTISIEMTV